LFNWHEANGSPDNLEERIERLTEAVALAEGCPDGALQSMIRQRRLSTFMERGDLRAVEGDVNVLQSIGREYRIRNNDKWVAIHRAAQCMLRGAYELAEQHAREGLLAGQDVGDPDALSIFGAQLFQIRWDQGRLPELESLASQIN
jgi:hypothetical protein